MDVGSAVGCWDGCEEKVKIHKNVYEIMKRKVKRGKG
jgi:hypothetical protein